MECAAVSGVVDVVVVPHYFLCAQRAASEPPALRQKFAASDKKMKLESTSVNGHIGSGRPPARAPYSEYDRVEELEPAPRPNRLGRGRTRGHAAKSSESP